MSKATITFAAVNVGVSEDIRLRCKDEVLAVPDEMWHYNEFRGCHMLPLYNAGGTIGRNIKGENMIFTPAGDLCPNLKKIILENIFPWMDPPGRCTILRTPKGYGLNPHFDAVENEISTRQEKYRLVLNGKVDKLYFLDEDRNKIFIPEHYKSYVMDGGHVHSLEPADEPKITLCVGAPWTGERTVGYESLLKNSPFKLKVKQPEKFEDEWLDPFWKR